jgi:hypothetical protein
VTALENGIGVVVDNLTIEKESKEEGRHVSRSKTGKGRKSHRQSMQEDNTT